MIPGNHPVASTRRAQDDASGSLVLAPFLLIVFSGFYATKAPISPVYLCALVGAAAMLHAAVCGRCGWYVDGPAVILVGTIAWIAGTQFYLGSEVNHAINALLGPVVLLLLEAVRRAPRERVLGWMRWFVLVTLLVCTAEAGYRLTHPDFEFLQEAFAMRGAVDDVVQNAFKYSSFMYPDSNYVGLQLALLLALQVRVGDGGNRGRWLLIAWNIVLVVASLSRASMIAAGAVLGWEWMARRAWARIVVPACAVVVALSVLPLIAMDTSYLSKFDILNAFALYAGRADSAALLLGVGAGRAETVLGVGAHNLLVTYVLELGLISTLLLFVIWVILAAQGAGPHLLLVLFVNGFAFTTLAVPFLYVAFFLAREVSRASSIKMAQAVMTPQLTEEAPA